MPRAQGRADNQKPTAHIIVGDLRNKLRIKTVGQKVES